MGVGSHRHTANTLPLEKKGGSRCTRGWVSLGAGPDESRKPPTTVVRTPDRPARSESLHREFYNTEHKHYSCTFGRDLRKIISKKIQIRWHLTVSLPLHK
jgi:hypothetical protein